MLLELLALGASMYVLFGPYVGYEHGQTRYLAVLPALVALLLFMAVSYTHLTLPTTPYV